MGTSATWSRKTATRSVRIRLAAIVLAVLATLVLVALAIGTHGQWVGPPIVTGPSICVFEALVVPCS